MENPGLKNEFVPAVQTGSRRLMVVLHGLGDSIEGYRWLPSMLNFPWLNYLLVNAPDDYYGGFSWYDFAQNPGPGVVRSRQSLFRLLDAQQTSGFPSDQTLIFGFSQGCLMTLEIGLRYPHLLAGLVGISGYCFEPENALRELSPVAKQQRFLLTHGTRDPLIPIAPVKKQMELLRNAGLNIEWHEFAKEHTIQADSEIRAIQNFIRSSFAGRNE